MISIDDVTLTAKLEDGVEVRMHSLRQGLPLLRASWPGPGREEHPWTYTTRPGLTVAWCEETRTLNAKISFPRLWGSIANFPLPSYESLDDVPLGDVCRDILGCLGLSHVLADDPDPVEALGMREMGVRKIAYAIDLDCRDIPGTLRALRALRRRNKSPKEFDSTGAQWRNSDRYSFKAYDKAAELATNKTYDRATRRGLSDHAAGILRLEVTLPAPKHVRKLVGLADPLLPKLELMVRPDVAAKALRRELYSNLHLDDLLITATEADAVAGLAVDMAHRLNGRYKAGVRSQLVLLLALQAAGMGDDQIRWVLNIDAKRLNERRRDLRSVGYVGPSEPYTRRLLGELLEGFHEQVPDDHYHWQPLSGDEHDTLAVDAPWAPDEDESYRDPDIGDLDDPDDAETLFRSVGLS